MKRWTLLLLVALVGGLYWLRNKHQDELAERGTVVIEKPLLPGLRTERVQRLRIEHLERGVDLLLERDGYGRWYLSDPIAYPAENALVKTLLDYLHDATGPVVRDPDLSELSLAPPRVVVTLTQAAPADPGGSSAAEGGEASWRVELGAVDLDARRVHARVPGHPDARDGGALVTRVVRSIETTLDRNPDDYRNASCTTIPYTQVTELLRASPADPSLSFDVFVDSDVWRKRDVPRVSMDANGVGIIVRALTSLRVRRFVDDAPSDVAKYGLDDPRLQLELRASDGRRELIVLSTHASQRDLPPTDARWYAMRDGFPHVWEVRANDVQLLFTPTASLYDYSVVRSAEEDVLSVELGSGPGAGLVLERYDDGWWVAERGEEEGPRRRADDDLVGGLVARLVRVELGDYAPPGAYEPGDSPKLLVVRTRNGVGIEAALGASWRDPASGVEGPLLLRSGESIAAVAPPDLVTLFDLSMRDLEERLVHVVAEEDVDRIEVRHGDWTHVYRRQDRHWSVGERGQVDGARAVLLERLLRFEASEWLDDSDEDLRDKIRVGFAGRTGLAFTLGRLADGRLVIDTGERRALVAVDALQGDLHAALLSTFEGE